LPARDRFRVAHRPTNIGQVLYPDPMPKFGMAAFPSVWWLDVQKAAKAKLGSFCNSNSRLCSLGLTLFEVPLS
jgi:hypothetical protein